MGSRLIGELAEDVARRYVNLYERLTHISGEICALGKAIEILSLQDNHKEVGLNYLGSLIEGKGKEIDNLLESVFVRPDIIPFGLKGAPEDLLKKGKITIDKRSAVIMRSRVERLRPCLNEWNLKFQIEIHDEQIGEGAVKEILDYAGKFCGIGDFRPRFGRFMVIQFKKNNLL